MARLSSLYTAGTPQMTRARSDQVANSAGGYVFQIDAWDQLDRFLILGSEGGTYYIKPQALTKENAANTIKLIKQDGHRVVNRVVEISQAGRAVRNDPALFVLALCVVEGDENVRRWAYENLSKVARTGTHLFTFVENLKALGKGWGKGLRNAVANWYREKKVDQLQYQLIKYKQRNGWSHRDLLRLSHAKPTSAQMDHLFGYAVTGELREGARLPQVRAHMSLTEESTTRQVINAITEHNLPREAIPTNQLNKPEVWEALLQEMPLTALVRNLGKMSQVKLLVPASDAASLVREKFANVEAVRKARIHPMQVLFALKTYAQGGGFRGKLTWDPVTQIVDSLDALYYTSFGNVEPTGKRVLIGIDVSGSMSCPIMGESVLTCAEAAAAMAMVTARVESDWEVMGFDQGMRKLAVSPTMRLDQVLKNTSAINGGGTDCSLPMLMAKDKGWKFDTFIVLTDSETWAGHIQPFEALNQYRRETGIPAKLVVCAMTSSGFTIADPSDRGMLDCVGFDTNTPNVISDFSKQEM